MFWHAKGYTLWRNVEDYMRAAARRAGYQEVKTPQLIDACCGRSPGTGKTIGPNMFIAESEDRVLAVKPMNCPGHVQIFKQGIESTATCRCAWPSSARATATSRPARCTG